MGAKLGEWGVMGGDLEEGSLGRGERRNNLK